MSASGYTVPEQEIATLLKVGVVALSGDPTLLNAILPGLSDADQTSLRGYWTDHPLTVLSGYARSEGPFPLATITLLTESIGQDYTGFGEEALLGDDNIHRDGRYFKRRISGQYGIFIYAEHPSICGWYYRIVRRILNMGFQRLIESGLHEPTMIGQELAPDPRYTPENMYVRRLTLTLEYEERWTDKDALAAVLLDAEAYMTATGQLNVAHEDQQDGGVQPI